MCVLFGGRSNEREVSIQSGERMREALADAPLGDGRGPARTIGVELEADGAWRVGGRSLTPSEALQELRSTDVFLLALHGGEGENGALQGLLATLGRRCSGSGVLASAVAMDKVYGRVLMEAAGARVARALAFSSAEWRADERGLTAKLTSWPTPQAWVVKPRGGGSSVGVSVTRDPSELRDAVTRALSEEPLVLVEEWVPGTEVTGGVLDTPDRGLEALPIVEIRPHEGRFFDYEEKYSSGGAREVCPPESVDAALCERVQVLARLAHTTLRADGYSRSDFIIPAGGGDPVFLELNTLPGMTPRSLLPQAAAAAGIDYRTLCLWIAAEPLRRSGSIARSSGAS